MSEIAYLEDKQQEHLISTFNDSLRIDSKKSIEVRRVVASKISVLIGQQTIKKITPRRVLYATQSSEHGSVIMLGHSVRRNLGVSEDFPIWLKNNTNLRYDVAALTAASFVLAFGEIQDVIIRSKIKNVHGNTYQEELWEPEYKDKPMLRLPYRAAGTVAMYAYGSGHDLSVPVDEYPPHIAGLANPLRSDEFKQLRPCFTIDASE